VSGGRPSARRHRMRRSGWARVAAQLIAPVVLGLLIGGVLAYQAGSTNDAVHPVPLGAVPSPTPSFAKPSASTATASAASMTTPAATRAIHRHCGITVAANPSKTVKQTATANAPGRC